MKKLLVALLLAALLLASFAFAEETEADAEELFYELSEDGTVFTIRLDANATTGYQWLHQIEDETLLELIAEDYVPNELTKGLAGAGGTYVASFKAVTDADGAANIGMTQLTFAYARAWEEGEVPLQVLVFNVTVAADGTLTVE